jgi:hypothetical protein
MRVAICRDKTLASETILYLKLFGREFYGWCEGSPAVGYRLHFSQSLHKDWWLIGKTGKYVRLPSETWTSRAPGEEPSESDS